MSVVIVASCPLRQRQHSAGDRPDGTRQRWALGVSSPGHTPPCATCQHWGHTAAVGCQHTGHRCSAPPGDGSGDSSAIDRVGSARVSGTWGRWYGAGMVPMPRGSTASPHTSASRGRPQKAAQQHPPEHRDRHRGGAEDQSHPAGQPRVHRRQHQQQQLRRHVRTAGTRAPWRLGGTRAPLASLAPSHTGSSSPPHGWELRVSSVTSWTGWARGSWWDGRRWPPLRWVSAGGPCCAVQWGSAGAGAVHGPAEGRGHP